MSPEFHSNQLRGLQKTFSPCSTSLRLGILGVCFAVEPLPFLGEALFALPFAGAFAPMVKAFASASETF